ncbi:hypothetical protein HGRIS_011115 [Hohenbuehelia grisea]|uniref:Extracellular membrane protein CFEM domain-containing protein n=1 Tax=Hohenbuehelia grisea TaxID=104357 RepID=A0ABR3IZC8_9AGAR
MRSGLSVLAASVLALSIGSRFDVCASPTSPSTILNPFFQISHLFARQTETFEPETIPPTCRPRCSSIINTIRTCTTPNCACTIDAENSLVGCLDCLVGLGPSPELITQAQLSIDQFIANCASANINLPPRTISPNGTSASVSAIHSGSTTLSIIFPPGPSTTLAPAVLSSALSDIMNDTRTRLPPTLLSSGEVPEPTATSPAGSEGTAAGTSGGGASSSSAPTASGSGSSGSNGTLGRAGVSDGLVVLMMCVSLLLAV